MKNYAQTLQILNNKTLTAGLLFLTSHQCRKIIRGKSFIQRTKYIRAERKQLIEETSFCYLKKTKKTAKYLLLEVVATGYVAMRSHDKSEALFSKQRNIFLVLTG